jgi:hypothetical protein
MKIKIHSSLLLLKGVSAKQILVNLHSQVISQNLQSFTVQGYHFVFSKLFTSFCSFSAAEIRKQQFTTRTDDFLAPL